jgi:acetolactate synthase small subunit
MDMSVVEIEQHVFTLRGVPVMLDRHLAELYQVETKYINRTVKRNPDRFPDGFMFRLTTDENIRIQHQRAIKTPIESLRFQNGTLKNHTGLLQKASGVYSRRGKHSKYIPCAFTEEGVAMLSAVLHSDMAVQVSIKIIQAFVKFRKVLKIQSGLSKRVKLLEYKQSETDIKFEKVFNALEARSDAPAQGIFFEGQISDAWLFVSGLIQSAQQSIELWDHYIDASVLMLLSKRKPTVSASVYLKKISPALRIDIERHHAQYDEIHFEISTNVHDRFLLIDNKQLFHIGASLKDLEKRCFAFSALNDTLIPEFRKNILSARMKSQ